MPAVARGPEFRFRPFMKFLISRSFSDVLRSMREKVAVKDSASKDGRWAISIVGSAAEPLAPFSPARRGPPPRKKKSSQPRTRKGPQIPKNASLFSLLSLGTLCKRHSANRDGNQPVARASSPRACVRVCAPQHLRSSSDIFQ